MEPDQDPSGENDQSIAVSADAGAVPGEFNAKPFLISLTLSKKRVLHLVSQSKTNREIADHLRISHATIKRYIENILQKLNLRNRVQVAIYALSAHSCPGGDGSRCPLQN